MYIARFTKKLLLRKLRFRVRELYENERQLLIDNAGERAIVFRLGTRMINDFRPATVYAEYNRMHSSDGKVHIKTINGPKTVVCPDLVVFTNDQIDGANKLVVEVKKIQKCSETGFRNDIMKLEHFTSFADSFLYLLGCHLILDANYFLIVCYCAGHPRSILKCDYDHEHNHWTEHRRDYPDGFEYNTIDELMSHIPENEER